MATAEAVPASEVRAGDVLALPGHPHAVVTEVATQNLPAAGQGGPDRPLLLLIKGGHDIARLPHELLFRVLEDPGGGD